MTKITRKEALSIAINALSDRPEVTEVLSKMIASLEKKSASTGEHKPTKTQLENEATKSRILDLLIDSSKGLQAKDIASELELSSVQKASALLKQLVDTGKVVTAVGDKKVTLFKLPEANA